MTQANNHNAVSTPVTSDEELAKIPGLFIDDISQLCVDVASRGVSLVIARRNTGKSLLLATAERIFRERWQLPTLLVDAHAGGGTPEELERANQDILEFEQDHSGAGVVLIDHADYLVRIGENERLNAARASLTETTLEMAGSGGDNSKVVIASDGSAKFKRKIPNVKSHNFRGQLLPDVATRILAPHFAGKDAADLTAGLEAQNRLTYTAVKAILEGASTEALLGKSVEAPLRIATSEGVFSYAALLHLADVAASGRVNKDIRPKLL